MNLSPSSLAALNVYLDAVGTLEPQLVASIAARGTGFDPNWQSLVQ